MNTGHAFQAQLETLLAKAVASLEAQPAPTDVRGITQLANAISSLARAFRALASMTPPEKNSAKACAVPESRPKLSLPGLPVAVKQAKTPVPGLQTQPRPTPNPALKLNPQRTGARTP
jgi:hypothetical protein